MKTIIAVFLLVQCVNFVNAQNEQLIKDIEKYILEVDSLIRHCPNSIDAMHGHFPLDYEFGSAGGTDYTYYKKYDRALADSLLRNISYIRWEKNDTVIYLPRLHPIFDDEMILNRTSTFYNNETIAGITTQRAYDEKIYYRNNKRVAITKKYTKQQWRDDWIGEVQILETGKIILYINENEIFHVEKFGKIDVDVEIIAQRHNLTFRLLETSEN